MMNDALTAFECVEARVMLRLAAGDKHGDVRKPLEARGQIVQTVIDAGEAAVDRIEPAIHFASQIQYVPPHLLQQSHHQVFRRTGHRNQLSSHHNKVIPRKP